MMSPSWSPAAAAGLPSTTADPVPPWLLTRAPSATGVASSFWILRSRVRNRMPIHGRASSWPFTACSMMGRAMSTGMAKPMPEPSVATAVLMPTTAPLASTSGPPELPGLIAASVWMRLVMRVAPLSTEMSRPFADTMPLVTENE